LDKRIEIVNQLVKFRLNQDIKEIKRINIMTKEIHEKLIKRAMQLIDNQIYSLKIEMEKFCKRFPGPDSYLSLSNNRIAEERKKLINYIKREIDIFQKQSESDMQGDKAFNKKSANVEEIRYLTLFTWANINSDYDVSKLSFGRKIDFIKDSFKREIIFRDALNAYSLAENGFNKSAVILAGSIIEELLRLYLDYKNIHPSKNNFGEYIKLCESKGILKKGISQLSDSVRHFRNIVHLEKEISPKYTISKATAKNAVSSIFIISNDF